ncbi:hypothetical protein IH979_02300, partial [Patescibacteria group bacterium]|nr:hypothetical protein [Patescibacteria group bacterium]
PENVIFILATTEVHKIPATILSRCQRFDFHRIATPDIVARLKEIAKSEKVKISEDVLESVARLSEGCLRDAESLLSQIFALGEKEIGTDEASLILPVTNTTTVIEIIDAVARSDQKSALETLNTFVDQGGSVQNLVDEMIDFTRTMMLFSLGGPYHDHYDAPTMESMRKILELISSADCRKLIDLLLTARTRPTHDAFPQLPLEIVLIELCEDRVTARKDDPPSEPPIATPLKKGEAKGGGDQDASPASFSIQELEGKWEQCCQEVAKVNIALPIALHSAKPLSIEGSIVKIGFEHKFHYETMCEVKNRDILCQAVNAVMRSNIDIKPIYLGESNEKILDSLIEAFGGSVVD